MNLWEGVPRWINTVLLVIVGFIGFNTLFLLLEANETNVIVDFVRDWANFFLAPFEGMFADQDFLLTALIAVLGYSLAAGIALAIVRSVQATARSETRAARSVERPVRQPQRDREQRGDRALRAERDRESRDERERREQGGRGRSRGRAEAERPPRPAETRVLGGRDERVETESEPNTATGDDGQDRTERLER